jgi:hypothetical protein
VYATVGLDLQYARSCIAVAVGDDPFAPPRIVGDGSRELIPNAAHGGRWGSAAAAAVFPAGSGTDPWRPWLVDVAAAEFVRGVRERVDAYLGQHERSAGLGITLVGNPTDPTRERAVVHALDAASRVTPTVVDPADALLQAHGLLTGGGPAGPVDVVAAGERWTVVRRYAPDDSGYGRRRWHRLHPGVVLRTGSTAWTDRLTHEVLSWSEDRDPAPALLAVEDGVLEFADALRCAERGEPVRWWGALGSQMNDPFELSWAAMTRWPEVGGYLGDVAHALVEVRFGDPLAAGEVLLGGPGAAWPFLAEAVPGASSSPLVGPAPAYELAAGAATWSRTGAGPMASADDEPRGHHGAHVPGR